jgi:membrane-bound serine protease (ClpP class)
VTWLIGAALVVCIVAASVTGLHAGGHGLIGPVVALALGAGWLVATASLGSGAALAWWLAGTSAAASGLAMAVALPALGYRKMPAVSGSRALVGMEGRAVTDLAPSGVVSVRGETWTAEGLHGPIHAGAPVRVASVDGVRLRVWSEEEEGTA